MRTLFLLIGATSLSLGLLACGDGASKSEAAASGAAATTGAAKSAAPKADAPKAEAPKPVEMKEHDLSSAHESWKGWVAQGPANAKVLADGFQGARIAADGPGLLNSKPGDDAAFDLAFEAGKEDHKQLKELTEKGAKAIPDYQVEVAWLKEEPGLLVWKSTGKNMTMWNFSKHLKIDGKDYTCRTNYAFGAGNEAQLERFIAACDTLKKK
jgi:hypothetical protein